MYKGVTLIFFGFNLLCVNDFVNEEGKWNALSDFSNCKENNQTG